VSRVRSASRRPSLRRTLAWKLRAWAAGFQLIRRRVPRRATRARLGAARRRTAGARWAATTICSRMWPFCSTTATIRRPRPRSRRTRSAGGRARRRLGRWSHRRWALRGDEGPTRPSTRSRLRVDSRARAGAAKLLPRTRSERLVRSLTRASFRPRQGGGDGVHGDASFHGQATLCSSLCSFGAETASPGLGLGRVAMDMGCWPAGSFRGPVSSRCRTGR
jgi:hypothetical protein